jgi:cytochrome c553
LIPRTILLLGVLAFAAHASNEEAARKVLSARCWACHAQTAMGGLRLDSREAMEKGGKSGPALVPGNSARSRLFQAVSRAAKDVLPMPPGPSLPASEVEALRKWIDEGAPWRAETGHWAFRPLQAAIAGETIDTLLARAHAAKGLTPAPLTDRRTLIRRLYLDLVGLPPTPEEFNAANTDMQPDWLPRLVDRLLASPHFGEKWARHWLDVARFGEDDFTGTEVVPYPNAWRYRDWVVQAMNLDLPYDKFLMAQLAGDLMGDPALLPATGLLGLGPWYYGISQPPQARADERNDRVDMVTRGMLGVTVACARCHDHKYDPISIKEYYALAGVFASTAYREYPLVPESEAEDWRRRKKAVDDAAKALSGYLDKRAQELANRYAHHIAEGMLAATFSQDSENLPPQIVARWKEYLSKPEEHHPYLRNWFSGQKTPTEAGQFQRLILEIIKEKNAVDAENERILAEARKNAPPVRRTIVLPGGYRSDEDFNPGAEVPAKSLDRDRFVAWNRTMGEKSAPLRLDHDLTASLLTGSARDEYERLKAAHDKLKSTLPPQYPFLHGAAEFEPWDLQLHIRGNPEQLGDVVPRGFPAALSGGQPMLFRDGSGRLELARTVARHPLAARVAVNRIWLALFGQGLVTTPSNFGNTGDRPVLPELLEYLAVRFSSNGYSAKALIREIALSAAYQRQSNPVAANESVDAANRFFWRQNRRRLHAEPLMDSMLAVSGELDRTIGGPSQPMTASFRRRSIYAQTSRFQQDETLSLFDLPSAQVTCEQRVVTTVPLQKLFVLNSEITKQRALALARRVAGDDWSVAIRQAYMLLYQRLPDPEELRLAHDFLTTSGPDPWPRYAWVLLSANEFVYVD